MITSGDLTSKYKKLTWKEVDRIAKLGKEAESAGVSFIVLEDDPFDQTLTEITSLCEEKLHVTIQAKATSTMSSHQVPSASGLVPGP